VGVVPHEPIGPEPQEPLVIHIDDLTGVVKYGVGGGFVPKEEDPDEYLEDREFIRGNLNGYI
jgi:hypothetical protein